MLFIFFFSKPRAARTLAKPTNESCKLDSRDSPVFGSSLPEDPVPLEIVVLPVPPVEATLEVPGDAFVVVPKGRPLLLVDVLLEIGVVVLIEVLLLILVLAEVLPL